MNRTKIEWVRNPDGSQGYTWNPVTGCENGCSYCYARRIAMRFDGHFDPMYHPDRIDEPLKRKKPTGIFVCSMADLFGAWVPKEWIEQVHSVIEQCPQHRFYLLTKNPERYADMPYWPCWCGVTATDQKSFDLALSAYRDFPCEKSFISCEPLLDPIRIPHPFGGRRINFGIDWLIIGAQTGPGSQKHVPKSRWIRDLISDCRERGIPCFVKDNVPLSFMRFDDLDGELRRPQEMP